MSFNLSWPFILIAGAVVLALLGFFIIRWQRTRSEEEITSGFRDGDRATVAIVIFLGLSCLPFASMMYMAAGIALALYVVFYIVRHYVLEYKESWECVRPLTPAEQRIADDTLLYARKHKKLPPQSKPTRPTRQAMERLVIHDGIDRTVWPYNRLDWTLIDRPNPPVPGNS
jgi:hypothetical protein